MNLSESDPDTKRRPRIMRTVLAVPGHRLRMLQSAAACAADAVFIDLEDAVPPDKKNEALMTAVRALAKLDWGAKNVAVRINANEHGIDEHEIRTLVAEAPRLDSILIPKVESTNVITHGPCGAWRSANETCASWISAGSPDPSLIVIASMAPPCCPERQDRLQIPVSPVIRRPPPTPGYTARRPLPLPERVYESS
jgi:hypothetical protein